MSLSFELHVEFMPVDMVSIRRSKARKINALQAMLQHDAEYYDSFATRAQLFKASLA